MFWKRNKKKVKIKINFNRETQEIEVLCEPQAVRPTEIIQILMYAISTVNMALKNELGKRDLEQKKKKITYIG